MKASEIRQLLDDQATLANPGKSGHTTVTVNGPKGESTVFIVRNTSTEEYERIVDALHEFKYEVERARRGGVPEE